MNWSNIIASTALALFNVALFYGLCWLWTDSDLTDDLFTVGAALVLILSPKVED